MTRKSVQELGNNGIKYASSGAIVCTMQHKSSFRVAQCRFLNHLEVAFMQSEKISVECGIQNVDTGASLRMYLSMHYRRETRAI